MNRSVRAVKRLLPLLALLVPAVAMGQDGTSPLLSQFARQTYRLTAFTVGGQEIALSAKPAITIRFAEDGKLSGRSTVNIYFGSLQLNAEGDISWGFAGLAVTRRSGPQTLMDLESLYVQALERTTKLTFDGSALTFSSTEPAIGLTFEVQADPHSVAEFYGTPLALTRMVIDGEIRLLPASPLLTVTINAMGTCSGFSGVNRYFGKFVLARGGGVDAGPFGSTMMAGPAELMELESAFQKTLGLVKRVEAVDNSLRLLDSAGSLILSFELR